jgi:hypothetical protein
VVTIPFASDFGPEGGFEVVVDSYGAVFGAVADDTLGGINHSGETSSHFSCSSR